MLIDSMSNSTAIWSVVIIGEVSGKIDDNNITVVDLLIQLICIDDPLIDHLQSNYVKFSGPSEPRDPRWVHSRAPNC